MSVNERRELRVSVLIRSITLNFRLGNCEKFGNVSTSRSGPALVLACLVASGLLWD